ncbi:hypothetical protein MTO96_027061 [Rhipicephalus appendiculatus]
MTTRTAITKGTLPSRKVDSRKNRELSSRPRTTRTARTEGGSNSRHSPQPDTKQAENNEDQDTKDTRNIGLKGSPQREIVSAVEREDNGDIAGEAGSTILYHSGKRFGYHVAASFEQNDYTSVGEWEEMRGLLYEKVMDRLIPEDLRIIYRAARRALQRVEWPEWMGGRGLRQGMPAAAVYHALGRVCDYWGRWITGKPGPSYACWLQVDPWHIRDGSSRPYRPVDTKGGYIYSQGTDQLRKEDAAAAIIQRWARTEFKRWLRDRALSRSSIETPPFDSQRWIDQDHGAFVSTILKDRCVKVHALGPPEGKLRYDTKFGKPQTDPKVAFEKCLLEIARRGGDHGDSSPDTRRRQKLSRSSATISKVLLRLESGADPRASQSPVSKPP